MVSSFNQTFNRTLVILLLCCSFLVRYTIQSRTPRPIPAARDRRPTPAADNVDGVVVCDKVCLYIVINFPAWEGCNPTYPNSTQVVNLMNHLQRVSDLRFTYTPDVYSPCNWISLVHIVLLVEFSRLAYPA